MQEQQLPSIHKAIPNRQLNLNLPGQEANQTGEVLKNFASDNNENVSNLPLIQKNQMPNSELSAMLRPQEIELGEMNDQKVDQPPANNIPIIKAIRDHPPTNSHFYYELFPKYNKSTIVTSEIKDGCQELFFQTILPFVIAACVQLAIWGIQRRVNDYCYIGSVCACKGWDSKFWSFFRQLALFKLSNLSCKKIIIKNATKQNPYMEIFFIYFFTIGIDFIILTWIEENEDWVYIILVFIIGIIIPTHTLRFKNFSQSMWDARGLWLYELTLFISFYYAFFGLPAIYDSFIREFGHDSKRFTPRRAPSLHSCCPPSQRLAFATRLSHDAPPSQRQSCRNFKPTLNLCSRRRPEDGKMYYIYLFPLFDLVLDLIIDSGFQLANYGEAYLYQVQQMHLGLRIGMVICNDLSYYEFWYLLITFTIMRISNSSQILYIAIRRMMYELAPPQWKKRFGMKKFSDQFSSKQGSQIENSFLWLIVFSWIYFNENVQPPSIYKTNIVTTCQFGLYPVFSTEIPWKRALVTYILFIIGEFTGMFLNYETCYDTIKWYGYKDCNLYDNIVMRLSGWYIFQTALFIPMTLIKSQGDTIFLDLVKLQK